MSLEEQQQTAKNSALEKPFDSRKYKQYAIAYSSAKPTGFMNYYFWLEVFAWLFCVSLVIIICFAAIPSFHRMQIPLWFAPQFLYPLGFISVIFFVGPPPYNLKQLQLMRHNVHLAYAFIGGIAVIGANIAFIVLQAIYAASKECSTDPNSLCQNSVATFVFMLFLIALLIVLAALSVITTATSFVKNKMKH